MSLNARIEAIGTCSRIQRQYVMHLVVDSAYLDHGSMIDSPFLCSFPDVDGHALATHLAQASYMSFEIMLSDVSSLILSF